MDAIIRLIAEDLAASNSSNVSDALDGVSSSARAAQDGISGYSGTLEDMTRRIDLAAQAESKTNLMRQNLADREFTRSQESAQNQIRILDEVTSKEINASNLRDELSNKELIRLQARINVEQAEAKSARDSAIASEENAIRQKAQLESLSGVSRTLVQASQAISNSGLTRASVEYSSAVADATQGTTGFATTLGHLGVAAEAISGGGMKGLIAGADLAGMAYGAIVPILKSVVNAVVDTAKEFVHQADNMGDSASIAGTSIEKYSQLSDAIVLMGEEAGKMQQGLTMMSRGMRGALETTGQLQGAMGRFGVSLFEADGHLKSSSDLMLEFSDIIAGMEAGPQKTALAMQVFGRSGAQLIPILDKGSAGLKAQAMVASALGSSYTKLDGDMADSLLAAEGRLDTFGKAAKNALGRAVTPTVIAAFNELGNMAERAFNLIGSSAGNAELAVAHLMEQSNPENLKKVAVAANDLNSGMAKASDGTLSLTQQFTAGVGMVGNYLVATANLTNSLFTFTDVTQSAKEFTSVFGNSMADVAESAKKLSIENYDSLAATEANLEAQKKTILASSNQTAASSAYVKQLDAEIDREKKLLAAAAERDPAIKAHVDQLEKQRAAMANLSEGQKEDLVNRNLSNKANQIAQQLDQQIFGEKAKLIAQDITHEKELELAVLRSNSAVMDSRDKLAAARATVNQQMMLSAIASEKSVFEAALKFDQMRQNAADEMAKAVIAADEGIFKATQAFEQDRATVSQQMAKSRIEAEKSVFDESVKLAQLRANAEVNLAKAVIQSESSIESARQAFDADRATRGSQLASSMIGAEKAVFDAETAFDGARQNRGLEIAKSLIDSKKSVFDAETAFQTQALTQEDQVTKSRISLQTELLNAGTARVERQKNADLRAAKSVADADASLDQAREDYANRGLTRTQRLAQAQLSILNQLKDKEETIESLKAEIANKSLIRLEAKRNVELEIVQHKRDQAVAEAEVSERANQGAAASGEMAAYSGQIASGIGQAAESAGALAGNFAQAAQAAVTFAGATAQIKAAAAGIADRSGGAFGMTTGAGGMGEAATFGKYKGPTPYTGMGPWSPYGYGSAGTQNFLRLVADAKAFDKWDQEQAQIKSAQEARMASSEKARKSREDQTGGRQEIASPGIASSAKTLDRFNTSASGAASVRANELAQLQDQLSRSTVLTPLNTQSDSQLLRTAITRLGGTKQVELHPDSVAAIARIMQQMPIRIDGGLVTQQLSSHISEATNTGGIQINPRAVAPV